MSTLAPPPASLSGQAASQPTTHEGEQLQELVDEAKGAAVHSFPSSSSPSEKAALASRTAASQVGKMDTSGLPPSVHLRGAELAEFQQAGGSSVPSDTGEGGSGGRTATTTSLRQVERVNEEEKEGKGKEEGEEERGRRILKEEGRLGQDGEERPPGALPGKEAEKGKVREIPGWFAIGWTGQDRTLFLSPEELKERSLLADFVSDAYYGQWYHNAGIILFAILASHFLTLLGGGWGWLIVVCAVCATYYETSIKRVRRNARDDLVREVQKKGLVSDVESAGWINAFMQRFWLIYEPVLSGTIVASVDQVLSVSTPAFLDSIRMTTFTLGTKPPRIDHVKTFPDTEDDIVIMEWKVSFTPNDLTDLTHAQAAKKVNPKIVLEVRFGIGPAVVGKDIVVEDIMFAGTMRVKLKLINSFPHVQTVDLSFMQPPIFDFVLKPIGFDLSLIPGLTPFITSTVHSSLAPMMYHPNTFTLNLEQMLSGAPIDTAVGVLAVTVRMAKGLKGTKLGGGQPDPYVSFAISGRAELARTKVKKSTSTPHWNETHYLLLNTLNDTLTLTLWDWNETRKDSDLGTVTFDLKSLADDGEQPGLTGDVIYDGKPRGQVKFDVNYFPVLKEKKGPDGTVEPVPETTSGVVRLVIHQAKDLDAHGQSQINPFFTVRLNDKPVHRSQTLKRTPNPVFERPVELLITQKSSAVLTFSLMDDNSIVSDTRLGHCSVKLTDILEANKKGNDWFPLSNARSGKVRVSAEWKPVLMAGAINGAGAYTPPLGVIRLWFKSSRDLKNVEGLTGGKSDPYVRVLHGGIIVARTVVHNNNLDPDYDEIVYVQAHSARDQFVIEVMDYQHLTKDRSLGSFEFSASGLIAEGPDKKTKPWIGTGKVERTEMLQQNGKRSVKGNISFSAEFFPCAHLKDVSFSPPEASKLTELAEEDSNGEGASTPTTASFISPPNSPTSLSPSAAGANGANGTGGGGADGKKKEDDEDGVTIPKEELLKTQTGVLAFQVISGQLAKKGARLEVALDDAYWPVYSTEPSRSTHNTWDEIGEVLIRELDFSQIHLSLNTAEKDTRADIIATTTIDMNTFLEQALDRPATFALAPMEQGHGKSTVLVQAKYIPVEMQILPRESINNSGVLRVDVLDAKNLPSADRNGKSDPYCSFVLNDEKVFKTEVIKKTLNPVWNEKFECEVPSREAARFVVEVHDWDRVGTSDKLGFGTIDLASLEPFESVERVVPLQDFKTGQPAGQVRIRLMFQVAFLRKARAATSTMTNLPGRIGTTIGGGVVGAGGAVLGAGGQVIGGGAHLVGGVGKAGFTGVTTVGKGVGTGVGAVGKGVFGGVRKLTGGGGHKKQGSVSSMAEVDGGGYLVPSSPAVGGADASSQLEVLAEGSPIPGSAAFPSNGQAGTLTVSIGAMKNVGEAGEKKAVELRWNGKKVGETHHHKGADGVVEFAQTFVIKTTEGGAELGVQAVFKKAFGSDKPIASASVPSVWQHVSPTTPSAQLALPLGAGQLDVKLEFVPTPSFLNPSSSRAASDADNRSTNGSISGASPSLKARSRFSSFGKRGREATPPVHE
ncbi:hypothetical protein JCM8547_006494 [Rhodosporidiobolus lusitaniae]